MVNSSTANRRTWGREYYRDLERHIEIVESYSCILEILYQT